ncbi:MAG: DUF2029 domain-containing protein [Chloroflexi bacterium]|nr:DUF2029 domain-containing protein [Chloroflexota bacterium]
MMMKRYRRTALSQYALVTLVLVLVLSVGYLGFVVTRHVPYIDNFAIPWAAGRVWLLEGGSPYGPAAIDTALAAMEEAPFMGQLDQPQLFSQPLFSLAFYLPFSLLPFTLARTFWVTSLSFFVGFIGVLSIKLIDWKLNQLGLFCVIIVLLFSLPGAFTILGGYITPIIIGMLLSSIYLIQNHQDTTAGFLLALASSCFLTIGLVIVLLLVWAIAKKRWPLIVSFFSGILFLVIISFLIMPTWFLDWASVLLRLNIDWNWIRTPLMGMAAILPGIAKPLSISLHGLFFLFGVFFFVSLLGRKERAFIYNIFSLLLLSYFLHLQASIVVLFLIVPALIFVVRYWSERWKRAGFFVGWAFLILTGAVSWFFAFPDFDFTHSIETPWLIFGYPLVTFVGMIWIRWWTLKIPKMPLERL